LGEETLVSPSLSEARIKAGADLVRALDERRVPVTAAMWLFHPESMTWRLNIATPEVRHQGPKGIYKRIQKVLGDTSLSMNDIAVRDSHDPLIDLFRVAIRTTGPDIAGIRFSGNTINGVYIPDAYIYRSR
jgi:hypothetical protein